MAEQDRTQLENTRPDWLAPVKGSHHMKFQPAIYFPAFKRYGLWSPTSPHNHRIVNRTWGLLQEFNDGKQEKLPTYSKTFQYRDGVIVPHLLIAFIVSLIVKFNLTLMAWIPPVSLPKSEEQEGELESRAIDQIINLLFLDSLRGQVSSTS